MPKKMRVDQVSFESEQEFYDWIVAPIRTLQSIIMQATGLTPEDIDRMQAMIQATTDQKRAEIKGDATE